MPLAWPALYWVDFYRIGVGMALELGTNGSFSGLTGVGCEVRLRYLSLVLLLGLMGVAGCGLDSLRGDVVYFSPRKMDFGSQLVGSRGLSQGLELVNLGKGELALGAISISGAGAGAFQVVNPCGTSLAGRGRCSVQVSFIPAGSGAIAATLSIAGKAGSAAQTVALGGTGSGDASADVVVYGATPAGVMAAVEAGRHGKTVLLVDPARHIGGMMSNGLGYSDLYADTAFGGLPKDFFGRVYAHYKPNRVDRKLSNLGRSFEPHVAEATFEAMLGQYKGVSAALGVRLTGVEKSGTRITGLVTQTGLGSVSIQGKVFVDASYTGDVMAAAGVSYTVGRESAAQYGEDIAGVNIPVRMGNQSLSAYVRPGEPGSGLIAHVSGERLAAQGSADKTLMGYNYRLCLSSDPKNQIPFTKPVGYKPAEYELMGRIGTDLNPPLKNKEFLDTNSLPNQKFDLNNTRLLFSMDEVGVNSGYPDGSVETRAAIDAEQKRYMQGLLYFLATDERIPATAQSFVRGFGLCRDEFTDNGGWPAQLYVREARRMVGAYVMTEKDLKGESSIPDSIGLGGYGVDDHLHHIVNVRGVVHVEAGRGLNVQPYAIPYRALTPKVGEVTNLLVPVEVSASHVAYDSLRVELTYMIMGQAAGAGAALAMDGNGVVQDVGYGALRAVLEGDGVVVEP